MSTEEGAPPREDYQHAGYGDQQQYGGEQQQWTPEQVQAYYAQMGSNAGYGGYGAQNYGGYYGSEAAAAPAQDYSQDYGNSYYSDRHSAGGPPPSAPCRSVWVGSLSPEATEIDLQRAFSPFGSIEHIRIVPQLACAFIKFGELDAAIKAHNLMKGYTICGQPIKMGWGRQEGREDESRACRNLWLGSIGPGVDEGVIRNAFSRYGPIEKIRTLAHKNCAFVNFYTLDAAQAAKSAMQGQILIETPIRINYGKDTEPPGAPGGGGGGGGRFSDRGDRGDRGDYYGGSQSYQPPPPPVVDVPPAQYPPPSDIQTTQTIDKLCEFVAKNGPQFEQTTIERQKGNPKFSFLLPEGMHHGYYKWRLWMTKHGKGEGEPVGYAAPQEPIGHNAYPSEPAYAASPNQYPPPSNYGSGYGNAIPPPSNYNAPNGSYNSYAPPSGYNAPSTGFSDGPSANRATGFSSPPPPPPSQDSGPGMMNELSGLLDHLGSKKETIKSTKTWIMSRQNQATDIIRLIASRADFSPTFESRLNIVYVVYDVLIHSSRNRAPGETSDNFSTAFRPHLKNIFASVMSAAGDEEERGKVTKVVRLMDEKKIYDSEYLSNLLPQSDPRKRPLDNWGGYEDSYKSRRY
ncbi:hypothetical protein PROFUN_03822 [Planoprotostelium fungivorum]|uniref:Uncharacterized protein n=1 Tax=Planoprotostelium fungivorum TaxID=1890364 RepID=A0A2P6NIA4_9EUKA|nr:hypothetical protein PROFUN_03822 [Planoprotostelium fungivorum]